MGACDFIDSAVAGSAKEAYNACVQDALYWNGHDPYNGTIATTEGFIEIPLNEGESLGDWQHRVMMNDGRIQKWHNCACVEDPQYVPDKGEEHLKRYVFAGWAAC